MMLRSLAAICVVVFCAGCQQPVRYAQFVDSDPKIGEAGTIEGGAKVLSADLIELSGTKIRLFGIKPPRSGDVLVYAYSLSVINSLTDAKRVYCTERWTEDDGTMVADCGVVSPSGSGTGLNTLLLRSGAAYLNLADVARHPKGTFSNYQADQFFAQKNCLGVWKAALIPPFTDATKFDFRAPGC